eukprot:scaffold8721_cov80-Phaeocystis_antarctica.AAC.45
MTRPTAAMPPAPCTHTRGDAPSCVCITEASSPRPERTAGSPRASGVDSHCTRAPNTTDGRIRSVAAWFWAVSPHSTRACQYESSCVRSRSSVVALTSCDCNASAELPAWVSGSGGGAEADRRRARAASKAWCSLELMRCRVAGSMCGRSL